MGDNNKNSIKQRTSFKGNFHLPIVVKFSLSCTIVLTCSFKVFHKQVSCKPSISFQIIEKQLKIEFYSIQAEERFE